MRIKKNLLRHWGRLSITKKFSLAFGTLLVLILLVSIGSYVALDIARKRAETAILNSMQIQRTVLSMDAGLERARRLQRDFFLEYPVIGFASARDEYAVSAVLEIANVITLSTDLQQLIEKKDVSAALRASDIDLTLYLSAAQRYSDTFLQAVELVTQQAAEPDGQESQMKIHSGTLLAALEAKQNPEWLTLYQEIQINEKDYLLTRRRASMQQVLNLLTTLQNQVAADTTLSSSQTQALLIDIENYRTVAEQVAALDAAIRSKFNDFNLQAESIDPISEKLIQLANDEVERARQEVERTNQLAILALGLTILAIIGLGGIIADLLHNSITNNIIRLTKIAGQLQGGNLDITVPITSEDELGDLAWAFNSMTTRLRDSFQSLQTSERHYRVLFEDSPVSLWLDDFSAVKSEIDHWREQGVSDWETYFLEHPHDVDTCISLVHVMDVNRATLLMHHQTDKAIFLDGIGKFFDKTARDVFTRELSALASGKTTYSAETTSVTMDGETLFLNMRLSIVPGYEETWARVLVSIIDITERKRTEDALRENEQRYRALFERNNDAVFILGLDGRHIKVNQRAADILGYSQQELEKMGVRDVIPPEEKNQSGERLQELLKGKTLPIYERIFRRKDGADITTELNAALVLDAAGKPLHIQSIVRDISERKRAENDLHATKSRLETIIRVSPLAIILVDRNDLVQVWNTAAENIFGWKAGEVLDQHNPIIPAKMKNEYQKLSGQVEQGLSFVNLETTRQKKDGTAIDVSISSAALYDQSGNIIGRMAIIADITERKQAETQILALNAELEQRVVERTSQLEAANKELEAFSYSVSHDLRAPLRAIHGYARILKEEFHEHLPQDALYYMERILYSAHHMETLIEDLLRFSRLSRQSIQQEPVSMDGLVKQALQTLHTEQENRHIKLELTPLPDCTGDTSLLLQVWVNLISNALKFTRTRALTHIQIGATQTQDELIYFVRDNGVGFNMAYADKLFGVFQRLHSNTEFEGTGVGLSLVQRIITRHGGRIWPESAPDEGTTFYFTIPFSAAD